MWLESARRSTSRLSDLARWSWWWSRKEACGLFSWGTLLRRSMLNWRLSLLSCWDWHGGWRRAGRQSSRIWYLALTTATLRWACLKIWTGRDIVLRNCIFRWKCKEPASFTSMGGRRSCRNCHSNSTSLSWGSPSTTRIAIRPCPYPSPSGHVATTERIFY